MVSYRSLLERCILPTWERVPLASMEHADVAAWVARLAGQVGPARCRKAATLLSGIVASAVRDQRLARNPSVGVSLPRLPEQRQRFLTMVELQQLAGRGLVGCRCGLSAAYRRSGAPFSDDRPWSKRSD